MSEDFDAFVIGSGPGGYAAAIPANSAVTVLVVVQLLQMDARLLLVIIQLCVPILALRTHVTLMTRAMGHALQIRIIRVSVMLILVTI